MHTASTACENFNLWITPNVHLEIKGNIQITAGESEFEVDAHFPQVVRYPVDKRFWEKLSTAVDNIVETMVMGVFRCEWSCRNIENAHVDNKAEFCPAFQLLRHPSSTAE
ncbi:ABC transporter permease [Corynebacterium glutamicum]|uniref:ABC transporter permease n=1 Tax=Corynebacterium glutamicum TaxID=1718 RepID=UPI001B8ADB90|nr:ABC transporter permease [Corynebacterium glutamicum]